MRSAALLACVLCVLLSGCGSDDAGPMGALASTVPEESAVYASITLDPEGDQEDAVRAIGERFPGGEDLDEQIADLLTQALEDTGLDYREDVEPWRGDEAAVFLTSISADGEDADGAAVIATTDEDAARDALAKAVPDDARKRSHKGTEYSVIADEAAVGIVDGNVVAGTESGMRAVIDTVEGGESVADSERVEEALEPLPDDSLASVYIDGRRLFSGLAGAAAQLGPFADLLGESYVVGVTAESDGVVVDQTFPASLSLVATGLLFGTGSDAIDELPADAWYATATADVGESALALIRRFGEASSEVGQAEDQLRAETGLDFDAAVGWMGDFAGFARGTSFGELGGGAVVESSDTTASQRAIAALGSQIRSEADDGERVTPLDLPGGGEGFTLRSPDLPEPVHVVQRGDRVAAAYGDDAAQALLQPGDTLADADAEAFQGARDRLGEGFAVGTYVDLEPILELVQSFGEIDSAEYRAAEPYLEPFSGLVSGTREEGETQLFRTRIELD